MNKNIDSVLVHKEPIDIETRAVKYKDTYKAYYDANKEEIKQYRREWHFKKKYGITLEEFDAMRVAQDFRCKLCNKHEALTPRKSLCVDHCHTSGKVRGLLCESCNQALGLFYDNEETLLKAAEYLKTNG